MYINDGRTLGIDHAVEMVALRIMTSHGRSTKISLGFGEILIMPRGNMDVMNPIGNVGKFSDAPISKRAVQEEVNNKAMKYYAEIPYKTGISKDVLKWEVMMVLGKIAIMETTGFDYFSIDDRYVYAVAYAYFDAYSVADSSYYAAKYAEEMVLGLKSINPLRSIIGCDYIKRELVEKEFRSNVSEGRELLKTKISYWNFAQFMASKYDKSLCGSFGSDLLLISAKLMDSRFKLGHLNSSRVENGYVEYLIGCIDGGECNMFLFIKELLNEESEFVKKFDEQLESEKKKRDERKKRTATHNARRKPGPKPGSKSGSNSEGEKKGTKAKRTHETKDPVAETVNEE